MDYIEWFYKRLTELRIQKNVSARDMSLSLGQSESYINKIENRRTLPSLTGFFYICDYLGITPAEFFNTASASPQKSQDLFYSSNPYYFVPVEPKPPSPRAVSERVSVSLNSDVIYGAITICAILSLGETDCSMVEWL